MRVVRYTSPNESMSYKTKKKHHSLNDSDIQCDEKRRKEKEYRRSSIGLDGKKKK